MLIAAILVASVSTANASWFGGNNGEWVMGPNGPYYEENNWPEWTPMYWMEEMADEFSDNDNNYYNRGYAMPMPYNNGYTPRPYGQMRPMPYRQPMPYYGRPMQQAPMYRAPVQQQAPISAPVVQQK